MLTSLFQSLVSSLGELMDIVMTRFLEVLNMDLSSYLDMFPLLDDTYHSRAANSPRCHT